MTKIINNFKHLNLENSNLFQRVKLDAILIFGFRIFIIFTVCCLLFTVFPAKALAAASLSFSPATKTVEQGKSFTLNVVLDTGGSNTDSADVIINYDSAKLSLVSSTLGSLYDTSMENTTSVTGKITLRQIASAGTYYNGSGTFATLIFKAETVGIVSVNFSFSANTTTDSNIGYADGDLLSSVSNGSYTIVPLGTVTSEPEVTGTITPAPTQPVTGGLTPTVTLGIFGTFFMVLGALAILF